MKILIAYFSKTGYTKEFAQAIENELSKKGYSVEFEIIKREKEHSWIYEVLVELPYYISIGICLVSKKWKTRHFKKYKQFEENIKPLKYEDVSEFDRICIGGPKWAHISYPVARYIKTVKGLNEKKIGSFATFGGPPLNFFEIELISKSMKRALSLQNATVISEAYISSNYHQAGITFIFRFLSKLFFKKKIDQFVLKSDYSNEQIKNFCINLGK